MTPILQLEYPVTRPFTIRHLNLMLLTLGIIWALFVTLFNVAAVAYIDTPITSPNYNSTDVLWYERMFPKRGWFEKSLQCSPTIIRPIDLLTLGGDYVYTLKAFWDPDLNGPVDGLNYQNYALKNCSLPTLSIIQTSVPIAKINGLIFCNTSIDQYLLMNILDTTATQPLNFGRSLGSVDTLPPIVYDTSKSLEVSTVLDLWSFISRKFLNVFASATTPGLLQSVVLQNNLTDFAIEYDDSNSADGSPNTPAAGSFTVYFRYSKIGDSSDTRLPLIFLSTGEIDINKTLPSDLSTAKNLLAPITPRLGSSIDPFRFINWFVITFYWQFLLDMGQTFPTTYTTRPQDISILEIPRFSAPVTHSSEYNIFLNSTLRAIYATYMNDTILPFLNMSHVAPFQPLEEQDLSNVPGVRTFVRSYACIQRKLRQGFSAFISVVVADYVFLAGGFKLFCIIAGMFQKRASVDANYCRGCQAVAQHQPAALSLVAEEKELPLQKVGSV